MARRRVVFLSPHLDDAVLSCGGLIAAMRDSARVEIWTIFTGAPIRGPYSPTALWLHAESGFHSAVRLARKRRTEDAAAAQRIGARHRHLRFREAAYRRDRAGNYLYDHSRQPSWHADDEPLIRRISSRLSGLLRRDDTLVAPLGLGGHVDHLIAHEAAARLDRVTTCYWADFPYVEAFAAEIRERARGMRSSSYSLAIENVNEWVDAINLYDSQVLLLEKSYGSLGDAIHRMVEANTLSLFGRASSTVAALAASSPQR